MKWIFVKLILIFHIFNYVAVEGFGTVVEKSGTDEGSCSCAENTSTQERLNFLEHLFEENRVTLCGSGMQDYRIGDGQLSSSGYWDSATTKRHSHIHARLFNTAQAWCAGSKADDADNWIQVDFNRSVKIAGVVTQGRATFDEWVTLMQIQHKSAESEDFKYVHSDNNQNAFPGNFDRNTLSITSFQTPVVGRIFRINVLEWKGHPSMRFDFLLC